MDLPKHKKKRGENWTPEEKNILRQLIGESSKILEDKSNKTSATVLKIQEWKNLTKKFNEIMGKVRCPEEIKLAWRRMKLSAKPHYLVLKDPLKLDLPKQNQPKNEQPKNTDDVTSVEDLRLSIVQGNTELKKRQIEIMEEEHQSNLELKKIQTEIMERDHQSNQRIAALKIKKLELEIAVLQNQYYENEK